MVPWLRYRLLKNNLILPWLRYRILKSNLMAIDPIAQKSFKLGQVKEVKNYRGKEGGTKLVWLRNRLLKNSSDLSLFVGSLDIYSTFSFRILI